ncbi:hypothetical protein BIW11_13300 [Tropilaelaps mercedesae]|uniref:von Hippel-Lindau disease tumour suppressor beta domain-containing protein n=1 Tax=Tropilaelaps mercedesae TaxID=418985 RepID=A0A1V9X2K2_9ACAR|nr:hypothetical protein BIW11_13300 [Tropilaelaps mercedesae]
MSEHPFVVLPWLRPRSKVPQANCKVFYKFVNITGFEVELFWLDFDGNRKSYGVLASFGPRRALDIDTYESHPWQAVPYKQTEQAHNATEASPPPCRRALPLNGNFLLYPTLDNRGGRRIVLIAQSVCSLKSLCLETVLRSCPEHPVRLHELELPVSVLRDLRTFALYGFCP